MKRRQTNRKRTIREKVKLWITKKDKQIIIKVICVIASFVFWLYVANTKNLSGTRESQSSYGEYRCHRKI